MPGQPQRPWWCQEGRFSKLSLSCDQHARCRNDRKLNRFRTTRQRFYHELDQLELAAWGMEAAY